MKLSQIAFSKSSVLAIVTIALSASVTSTLCWAEPLDELAFKAKIQNYNDGKLAEIIASNLAVASGSCVLGTAFMASGAVIQTIPVASLFGEVTNRLVDGFSKTKVLPQGYNSTVHPSVLLGIVLAGGIDLGTDGIKYVRRSANGDPTGGLFKMSLLQPNLVILKAEYERLLGSDATCSRAIKRAAISASLIHGHSLNPAHDVRFADLRNVARLEQGIQSGDSIHTGQSEERAKSGR